MKVAALAALGVLVAFSAGAAQQQRQLVSPATTCDNDGHCKTASADAAPAVHRIRPRAQKTVATAAQPLPQPRPSQTDSQAQQEQASEQQLRDTQQAQPQAEQTQDPQQAKPQQPAEQTQQILQAQRPQPQPHHSSRMYSMPTATRASSFLTRLARVLVSASPTLHVFRPTSTIWKTIMARACCS